MCLFESTGLQAQKKREGMTPSLMAGVQGFEPQLADPESAVQPLNDTPKYRVEYHIVTLAGCQANFSGLRFGDCS